MMYLIPTILLEILKELRGLRQELSAPAQYIPPIYNPVQTPSLTPNICPTCGINMTGTLGYVCSYRDCPTGFGGVTAVGM